MGTPVERKKKKKETKKDKKRKRENWPIAVFENN
jgi:hypothetical protein